MQSFLHTFAQFLWNCAWSLSSTLDAFSCKQSLIFACRQQLIKYRLFTTKTSCFFNAFLTHLRDLFLNRAWSLSSALGDWEYFVLSSPSLAVSSSLNIVCSRRKTSCFFNAFLTHLRDLFPNRAWSLSSALGDREYFVLSSPSLAVSSSLNIVCSRRKRRVFLMRF